MVVEEDCLATCDGRAARTHVATSRRKRLIMYRKMLNLRPIRDGGIMSASKFTREFTIDLAGRDEPALRDSITYCALLGGHNLVTV